MSNSVRSGCVLMSLSFITSFQECAGTAKAPATRNIFLHPCPGVGEHLDSKRQHPISVGLLGPVMEGGEKGPIWNWHRTRMGTDVLEHL